MYQKIREKSIISFELMEEIYLLFYEACKNKRYHFRTKGLYQV